MKFPVSVLPATVVLKELFNHACILLLMIIFIVLKVSIHQSSGWELYIIALRPAVLL